MQYVSGRRVATGNDGFEGIDKINFDTDSTYILVRNDFDILDMTRGLKDLTEHVFCYSWVEPTDVQGALIRLGSRTASEPACTAR